MLARKENFSGLPNSTVYAFLETITESVKRGDFDGQLKAYQEASDKLLCDGLINYGKAKNVLSRAEYQRFAKPIDPITGRSGWCISIQTSNGMLLEFFWEYSVERDFWLRKFGVMKVVCKIHALGKESCLEVVYEKRGRETKTVSGLVQLKDLWGAVCDRCDLFRKDNAQDLQLIDKKMQEFTELAHSSNFAKRLRGCDK